eukprot:1671390-Rhodomonas_salina.2
MAVCRCSSSNINSGFRIHAKSQREAQRERGQASARNDLGEECSVHWCPQQADPNSFLRNNEFFIISERRVHARMPTLCSSIPALCAQGMPAAHCPHDVSTQGATPSLNPSL